MYIYIYVCMFWYMECIPGEASLFDAYCSGVMASAYKHAL